MWSELLRDALLEIRHEARKSKSKKIEQLADLVHNLPTAITEGRVNSTRFVCQALKLRSEFPEMLFDYALKAREIRSELKAGKQMI